MSIAERIESARKIARIRGEAMLGNILIVHKNGKYWYYLPDVNFRECRINLDQLREAVNLYDGCCVLVDGQVWGCSAPDDVPWEDD